MTMRLGVMQPYFFPNLSHFALIAAVDEWIVFDVTQFTRKSWMTRNRILHPSSGWQYVNVAVDKAPLGTKTKDIRVIDMAASRAATIGKLAHYKRTAPRFDRVAGLVEQVFDNADGATLVDLNVSCLREACAVLEIPLSLRICSQLDLDFPETMGPGDWAPHIAAAVGATSYVNPIGGRELFDPNDFSARGVELRFAEFEDFQRETPGYVHVPGLSVLDALMWVEPEVIVERLKSGTKLV